MITVTATRHRHRDSSPRAIDPAAVVETTLLALDKMNECVDAFARRFATRSRRTLPAPFLLTRWVRAVFAAFTTTRVAETANWGRVGASGSPAARGGGGAGGAGGGGGGGWWTGRDSCTRALVGASRVASMWCDMGLGVCSSVYVSCVLIEL